MVYNKTAIEGKEYNISIIGKHIELTNSIKQYIKERVEKIEKLTVNLIDVVVRLDIQKLNHTVDIILNFSQFKVKVGATTEEMYSAIDKAFDKLGAKLRKWKGKIQDHHAKGVSVTEIEVNVLEQKEEEKQALDKEIIEANNNAVDHMYDFPKVIKKKKRPLKILTVSEAVMKMELTTDPFLIYRSEEEQKLKVMYRRHNGSYGIMSPE
tara:strand:+ start:245 stop:871 length:627 start_codon:yes stop_codon:yes gene_type:complete